MFAVEVTTGAWQGGLFLEMIRLDGPQYRFEFLEKKVHLRCVYILVVT